MSYITSTPIIGINIRDEEHTSYADLICDGIKKIETRNSDSLRPYVNKRVRVIRTGIKNSPSLVVGEVTIKEPLVYTSEKAFYMDINKHLVSEKSMFWIKPNEFKYGYRLEDPIKYQSPYPCIGRGIISRLNQPAPSYISNLNLTKNLWYVFNTNLDLVAMSPQIHKIKDIFPGKVTKVPNGYTIKSTTTENFFLYKSIDDAKVVHPFNNWDFTTPVKFIYIP